jgi:hypothetical protein
LGEPQQSSLLTTLFSFLSKFTAKSGEKVSVNKSVLWTVFSGSMSINSGSISRVGVTRKNRIYDNYKRQRIILSLIF